MKLKELETIYKVFDEQDDSFRAFYGTADDVIEYIKELQEANGDEILKDDESFIEEWFISKT